VTANENIVRGQPVYINNSNNQAGPAKAAPDAGPSYLRTQVVGFAEDTVSAGQTVTVRTEGLLTLANWTSIAGTTNLTTGVSYFLSETSGNITTTPPTTNNSVLIVVGRAVTPNTIDIEVGERIIL
ncbi:MAG: capsid cement protein, partial [Candidatus Kariarchaeaceae archaeon]